MCIISAAYKETKNIFLIVVFSIIIFSFYLLFFSVLFFYFLSEDIKIFLKKKNARQKKTQERDQTLTKIEKRKHNKIFS